MANQSQVKPSHQPLLGFTPFSARNPDDKLELNVGHLTTVNVDGGADDDVGDSVDVHVADAAVLLDEGPKVAAVGVLQLLFHAPHQRLNAVMVLQRNSDVPQETDGN